MRDQREAYVRKHLAEIGNLENEEIETWLWDERRATSPDVETWKFLFAWPPFATAVEGNEVQTLRSCARPMDIKLDAGGGQFLPLRQFYAQLAVMDPYRASVYTTTFHGLIVVFADRLNIPAHSVIHHEDWRVSFQPLRSVHALDALLTTWGFGEKRAEAARDFLCAALETEIRHIRRRATASFDEAVAVAADGRRILKADHVVLFENKPDGLWAYHYPKTAFAGHKLDLATEDGVQKRDREDKKTVAEFLQSAGGRRPLAASIAAGMVRDSALQRLVTVPASKSSIFFSHVKFLSGALPQNGAQISR